MDQEVAELLEQEERKVTERNAAKQRKNSDDATSPASTTHTKGHSDRASDRKIPDRCDPRNRYSAEREENDARRSLKSKDLAEDDDDEGSANGSDRSRPTRKRSRSPDRDRRRRSRDRDTYRERDHYRPGGGRRSDDRDDDGGERYYRPGGRRSRTDDRDRRNSRELDDRDRRDRRARDYDRRRDAPKKTKTPEPTDDERDRRTVFVQQLAAPLRTKELQAFFEQVGPVVEAQIVKDRVSGRSKG